jgi:hypothetical protein
MQPHPPREQDALVQLASTCAWLQSRYHRAVLENAEAIPRGPLMLVGNHGLYGWETPAFFYLLRQATGRFPFGLTDRRAFGWEPLKSVMARVGGIVGTPDAARSLLSSGHMVVCYPGGSREVFKRPDAKYRLAWERAKGFAAIAIELGVPVVPFAGLGVDDSYYNLGTPAVARRALGRYAVPFGIGLGPLPLPARFRFRVGAALNPPSRPEGQEGFKGQVQQAVETLLQGMGR